MNESWLDVFRMKGLERPLLSLQTSSIDLAPLLGLTLLFFVSLGALLLARRKTPWRWLVQGLSFGLLVLAVHRTMCILRGWIFGLQMVGHDDTLAFSAMHVAVALVAIALAAGGLFCGWMCPVGAVQEHLGRAAAWAKGHLGPGARRGLEAFVSALSVAAMALLLWRYAPANFFFAENVTAVLTLVGLAGLTVVTLVPVLDQRWRWFRYANLVCCMAIIFLDIHTTTPGCPIYETEKDRPAAIALLGVLLASVVLARAYCRYVCPFGALFGLLSRVSFVRISPQEHSGPSGRCGRCSEICPAGALSCGGIDRSACIMCGRCVEHCGSRVELGPSAVDPPERRHAP